LDSNSVPAISYHWDFGDGTEVSGQKVTHAYTLAGTYSLNLIVKGIEGLSAQKTFSITATGTVSTRFDLSHARRYTGPSIK
jgi:PKD repeat protein